jgi:hypothetical protein
MVSIKRIFSANSRGKLETLSEAKSKQLPIRDCSSPENSIPPWKARERRDRPKFMP